MKNLNFKRVAIAGFIAYTIGVAAFLMSFFIPVMSNPELQANIVLAFVIIPASMIGANFYLKRDYHTKGVFIGVGMFMVTMLLDAIITIPVFVIPAGGDYVSFFADPGFWLIALLYITAVTIYTNVKRRRVSMKSQES